MSRQLIVVLLLMPHKPSGCLTVRTPGIFLQTFLGEPVSWPTIEQQAGLRPTVSRKLVCRERDELALRLLSA